MLSAFRPAVLAAFACALSAAALAQEGARAPARPPPSPTLDAITDVADALGMIRGVQREWRSVNRIYFIASGSLTTSAPQQTNYKLTRGFIEMSFAQQAIRADLTLHQGAAKPARTIEVVRGDVAWDETTPGIVATARPGEAKARSWQLYATPHGAVRAAMEAIVRDGASLNVATAGQTKTFDVVSPAGPLRIVTDASDRPTRTDLTIQHPQLGQSKVVTEFSDYRDWEKLGVWFPARIRQTVNGAPSVDYTVSEFRTNPYVVFPYPPGQTPASAAGGG